MKPDMFEVIKRKSKEGRELYDKLVPFLLEYDIHVVIGALAILFRSSFEKIESKEYQKAYLMEFTNWIHQQSKKFQDSK